MPPIAKNFSSTITVEGKNVLVTVVPELRKDGMYYETNIKGYPRFYMSWSPLGRYDISGNEQTNIPYEVILAVSDIIEKSS